MVIAPRSEGGPASRAGSLAREMGQAYREMVEFYRQEMALEEAQPPMRLRRPSPVEEGWRCSNDLRSSTISSPEASTTSSSRS
jgi:hypothetical protein